MSRVSNIEVFKKALINFLIDKNVEFEFNYDICQGGNAYNLIVRLISPLKEDTNFSYIIPHNFTKADMYNYAKHLNNEVKVFKKHDKKDSAS